METHSVPKASRALSLLAKDALSQYTTYLTSLAAASNATLVGLPTYGPLTARNGLKRLSGYLDLPLCLYWVSFVQFLLLRSPELRCFF